MTKTTTIITVSIANQQRQLFENLKKHGYFPSISAGIRYCINASITSLKHEILELNQYIKDDDLINILKSLKKFGYTIHRERPSSAKNPMISIPTENGFEVIQ